jgi:hypothetical protein
MYQNHMGQGHRWCSNCRHMVRSGAGGCGTCRTPFIDLLLFDQVANDGFFEVGGSWGGGQVGFDPLDGQFAVSMGDGLAYEPGTGEVDVETPFGYIPVDDL